MVPKDPAILGEEICKLLTVYRKELPFQLSTSPYWLEKVAEAAQNLSLECVKMISERTSESASDTPTRSTTSSTTSSPVTSKSLRSNDASIAATSPLDRRLSTFSLGENPMFFFEHEGRYGQGDQSRKRHRRDSEADSVYRYSVEPEDVPEIPVVDLSDLNMGVDAAPDIEPGEPAGARPLPAHRNMIRVKIVDLYKGYSGKNKAM